VFQGSPSSCYSFDIRLHEPILVVLAACIFSLKRYRLMLLCQQAHRTLKTRLNYHLVTAEPSLAKRSTMCSICKLRLARKRVCSMFTNLHVYRVCHGDAVGHCVRNMISYFSSLEWKSPDLYRDNLNRRHLLSSNSSQITICLPATQRTGTLCV